MFLNIDDQSLDRKSLIAISLMVIDRTSWHRHCSNCFKFPNQVIQQITYNKSPVSPEGHPWCQVEEVQDEDNERGDHRGAGHKLHPAPACTAHKPPLHGGADEHDDAQHLARDINCY